MYYRIFGYSLVFIISIVIIIYNLGSSGRQRCLLRWTSRPGFPRCPRGHWKRAGIRRCGIVIPHRVKGRILSWFSLRCWNIYFKKDPFPVGSPMMLTSEEAAEMFDRGEFYHGFMNCTIRAPQDLLLPVLPQRCGGRLVFANCRCKYFSQCYFLITLHLLYRRLLNFIVYIF
jgi:hypothetical protein